MHLVWLEFWAIVLFIVGNSGLRILGIIEIVRKFWKKIDEVDVFMFAGLAVPLIIVLLFIQNGIVFNLIQFMQIFFHFFGIFAAASVILILKKLKKPLLRWAVFLLIVLIAIPTAIGNLFDFYYPGRGGPLAKVTNNELQALDWLKRNTPKEAVVLTKPFWGHGETRYDKQPWPISAWYSTAYVFVFSGRYAYLSGEEQLMITGYQTKDDLVKIGKFFSCSDKKESESFFTENKINYIYVRKDEIKNPVCRQLINLTINSVFENEEVLIYKINKLI